MPSVCIVVDEVVGEDVLEADSDVDVAIKEVAAAAVTVAVGEETTNTTMDGLQRPPVILRKSGMPSHRNKRIKCSTYIVQARPCHNSSMFENCRSPIETLSD